MKKQPTLLEQLACRCVHFTGISDGKCAAGVAYHDVRVKYPDSPYDWPCMRDPMRWPQHMDKPLPPCDKRRWPTEAELAAEEEEYQRLEEQLIHRIENDLCVTCGEPLTGKRQVGPCVYGDPCGHRQYQGRLK